MFMLAQIFSLCFLKIKIYGALCPPLHLGVVAIEKGAFWSPSTTVANFTTLTKTFLYAHYKLKTPSKFHFVCNGIRKENTGNICLTNKISLCNDCSKQPKQK